jgi:hypothetical protein
MATRQENHPDDRPKRSQTERLLRDLFAVEADAPSPEQIEAWMMAAAAQVLSDAESEQRFPQLWRAMSQDAALAEEYRLLMELAEAEAQGQLVRPAVMPPMPGLPAAATLPSLWRSLAAEASQLATEIRIRIVQGVASFGPLAAPLQVNWVPALAQRDASSGKAPGAEEGTPVVELPDAGHNVLLRLFMSRRQARTLGVSIGTLDPPQPLAAVRVLLRSADGSLLEGVATDADGLAYFGDLVPATYQVEVEYAGHRWTFGVALAAE